MEEVKENYLVVLTTTKDISLTTAATDMARGFVVVEVHLSSVQVAVLQEAAEQKHGAVRLISGDSVASALHSSIRILRGVLHIPNSGSIDKPRGPVLLDGALEFSQAKLSLRSRDSSHIDVSTVNQHLHIWTSGEEGVIKGNHALATALV